MFQLKVADSAEEILNSKQNYLDVREQKYFILEKNRYIHLVFGDLFGIYLLNQ